MVTVFSDPMVDVLTSLTDSTNAQYVLEGGSKVGQYIPIPGAVFQHLKTLVIIQCLVL